MNILIFSFLFFLPAGIANMTPVFVAKIPLLKDFDYPLDSYQKINGKRIFGDHKTIRGLIFGLILGVITSLIIHQSILLGFILSLGALGGDSIKSFLKRQVNISEGKSWFPFDQIDYIIGGLICSVLIIKLPFSYYVVIFILYFLLHLIITAIGYLLGFKKEII